MKKLALFLVLAAVGCGRQSTSLMIGYHGPASIYEVSCHENEQCRQLADKACPGERAIVGNPRSTRYWVECVK